MNVASQGASLRARALRLKGMLGPLPADAALRYGGKTDG
jgi:hypothetical protein